MGAPEVVLTRAARLDGAPTVPSRWLLRIEALLGGAGIADALAPPTATPWLDWVALARDVGPPQPAKRPDPRPPVEARPRRMSVSDVETWIANPYAIYARRVLDLEPLPDLAAEPGADLHGTLIHQALHRFVRAHPTHMPDKAAEVLIATFDQLLEEHAAHPRIAAFWRPRFARFASWFAETEAGRREGVSGIATEVQGRLLIGEATTAFELTARADRIDVTGEGLVIVDYKSGAPPNDKRVQEGTAPQLPLEAAIATARGFAGIAEPRVAALRYIRTHGGMPAGEVHDVGTKQGAPAELGAKALAGLEKLIAHYGIARTAYTPLRRARFAHAYRFDDFAHLARFGEWSAAEGEDD
jgi:ATP-dependent helicase/nuclease subunit B